MPIPVTVVGSHACYPMECRAGGLLFAGGLVVIDYPFAWHGNADKAFESDAPINVLNVLLLDGDEPVGEWHDIGVSELSAADFTALQARIQSMTLTGWERRQLPKATEILARLSRIAQAAPWWIEPGSGRVVARDQTSSG